MVLLLCFILFVYSFSPSWSASRFIENKERGWSSSIYVVLSLPIVKKKGWIVMIASLLQILKFEYFNLFLPYIFLCKIMKVLEKAFDVFLLVRMFWNVTLKALLNVFKLGVKARSIEVSKLETSRVMRETVSQRNASRYDRSGRDDC